MKSKLMANYCVYAVHAMDDAAVHNPTSMGQACLCYNHDKMPLHFNTLYSTTTQKANTVSCVGASSYGPIQSKLLSK